MPDENKPPGEVVPPQGQTDTAAVLNALGSRTIAEAPKVETPEEQQVRIVNESLRASLDQYDNLPPAEKAKVDPTLVARLEAFRTNPNALSTSAATAPAVTEPVASNVEPGISRLPSEYTAPIAGVPGGGAKVSTIDTTPEAFNKLGTNPDITAPINPLTGTTSK